MADHPNEQLRYALSAARDESFTGDTKQNLWHRGGHFIIEVTDISPEVGVETTTAGDDDPATNEVQEVTVRASGGTFTLTYDGQTTSALAYNVSAADMETALDALSNLADGDVEVTGGPGDITGSTPYVLAFGGNLAETDVEEITADGAELDATPSLTPRVQGKDPVADEWYDVLAGAAITAAGRTVLKVYPGITAAANVSVSDVLPTTWRVAVDAADADQATYSIGVHLIG